MYNAGPRTVAILCLNNLWGEFAQNPDRCTEEFGAEPHKFFELIFDDAYNVSDVQIINENCLYHMYKKSKEFQTAALNTNVIFSYISAYTILELEDCTLYCDTDLIIYRHVESMYNSHLSEFVGCMTDELGGSLITEFMSNGPNNYAYRTNGQGQMFLIKLCGLSAVDI